MSTQYNIYPYIRGVNGFGLPFSSEAYQATLATSTDTSLTVPGDGALGATGRSKNKFIAIIKPTAAGVWMSVNQTAQVPAGASFLGSNTSELVSTTGEGKTVQAGDVLHFITAGTSVGVSVTFYAIQE